MLMNLETQLKDLSKENKTSEAVFEALSQRMRARNVTNLNLLKYFLINNGIQIVTEQYIEVFKKLEALGVGSLIRGRKTKTGQTSPPRFVWHYNLKEVGKAAKGDKVSLKEIQSAQPVLPPSTVDVPESEHVNKITIDRDGFKINIDLPKNVTPEDLSAWLSLVKEFKK